MTRLASLKMVERNASLKAPLISAVWKFKAPKKVKDFLWSLAHRSLNTHDLIQKKCRNWLISPSVCSLLH